METIKIPLTLDELLADRLTGLHTLLTAREWERAAIVFAFTGLGGPRNTPSHHVEPPRVTLGEFARLGFKGLTAIKSVRRYRRSWEWAMEQGLAGEVNPGDIVVLPKEEFPSWNETLPEYEREPDPEPEPVGRAAARHELFERLGAIRQRTQNVIEWLKTHRLTPEQQAEALEYANDLGVLVHQLRGSIRGEYFSVHESRAAQKRWDEHDQMVR